MSKNNKNRFDTYGKATEILVDAKKYYEIQEYDLAEKSLIRITPEMGTEVYAKALLNLGTIQYVQGQYDTSEQYWAMITQDLDVDTYADAQLRLGELKSKQGRVVESEENWIGISSDMSIEIYALAQLYLGVLYCDQQRFDDAERSWSRVGVEFGLEAYANAQLNLGVLKKRLQQEDLALRHWENITSDMSRTIYERAQFSIGTIKYQLKDYDCVEKYFSEVSENNEENLYVYALTNIGSLKEKQNKILEAEKCWKAVKLVMDENVFLTAFYCRINLHLKYAEFFEKHDTECAITDFLDQFTTLNKEDKSYRHQIIKNISSFGDTDIRNYLGKIFVYVNGIVNELQLRKERNPFCQYFAHYTQHSTAFALLEGSRFRLNTTYFMNDPTEGKLVDKLFNISFKNPQNNYLAFASCFSFNHDSLNQFRLYGKTDNKENSGVSLVVKSDFFSENSFGNEGINLSSLSLHQKISLKALIPNSTENIVMTQEKENSKLPLYRCVYYDHDSGYLRVARRSKISFFKSGQKNDYDEYLEDIEKVEKNIRALIESTISSIKDYQNLQSYLNGADLKEYMRGLSVIDEILLPLRYLIKHAAFEEEEECRVIYITDLSEKNDIVSDRNNRRLYVDYKVPVEDYVHRIYLGKYAEEHRPFFERALGDKSKVRSSNNPFRT